MTECHLILNACCDKQTKIDIFFDSWHDQWQNGKRAETLHVTKQIRVLIFEQTLLVKEFEAELKSYGFNFDVIEALSIVSTKMKKNLQTLQRMWGAILEYLKNRETTTGNVYIGSEETPLVVEDYTEGFMTSSYVFGFFIGSSGQKEKWEVIISKGRLLYKHEAEWKALPILKTMQELSFHYLSADDIDLIAIDTKEYRVYYAQLVAGPTSPVWRETWVKFHSAKRRVDQLAPLGKYKLAISHRGDGIGWKDIREVSHALDSCSMGTTTLFIVTDNGKKIRYIDPWEGLTQTYIACPSEVPVAYIASSASTILAVDGKGRIFTRLAVFDQNGQNFDLPYSYMRYGAPQRCFMLDGNTCPIITLPDGEWKYHGTVNFIEVQHITIVSEDEELIKDECNDKRLLKVQLKNQYITKKIGDDNSKWKCNDNTSPDNLIKDEKYKRNPQPAIFRGNLNDVEAEFEYYEGLDTHKLRLKVDYKPDIWCNVYLRFEDACNTFNFDGISTAQNELFSSSDPKLRKFSNQVLRNNAEWTVMLKKESKQLEIRRFFFKDLESMDPHNGFLNGTFSHDNVDLISQVVSKYGLEKIIALIQQLRPGADGLSVPPSIPATLSNMNLSNKEKCPYCNDVLRAAKMQNHLAKCPKNPTKL